MENRENWYCNCEHKRDKAHFVIQCGKCEVFKKDAVIAQEELLEE